MAIERVTVFALVASSLISVACAIPGIATYGTSFVPSSCYGFKHRGMMIAVANTALHNNGAACGRRYRIRCIGPNNQRIPQPCRNGEITVTPVDLCPGCPDNQFYLPKEAFSIIGDPNAGTIRIEYNLA